MKTWLSAHGVTPKTVATVWVFLVGLWQFSPEFRSGIMGLYEQLPLWLHHILAAFIVPALMFWNTRRKLMAVVDAPPEGGSATITAKVNGESVAQVEGK